MNKYDAIIIGFGRGGHSLAAALAGHGWNVALVERSAERYGGACVNVACIPTKTMIHYSKLSEACGPSAPARQALNYRDAVNVTAKLTAAMRKARYDGVVQRDRLTLYTGEASFRSTRQVVVRTADGEVSLEGKKIIIDTGSEPVVPEVTGLRESKRVYTSESMLKRPELPRELVIIGGGYVGLEFAFMYAGFGSHVTVLDNGPRLLPREDEDIVACVRKAIDMKGIVFHENAWVQSVRDEKDKTVVAYVNQTTENLHELTADAVLAATGRKPAVENLNLQAAGVRLNDRGAIETDIRLRTSAPDIWAVGDVHGNPMFTYVSQDDFRIVCDQLLGDGKRTTLDREPFPTAMFIDPPLARIGLSEEEAFRAGCPIKVARLAASEMGRARTLGQPEGLMKVVVNADTGHLIGCTFFCAEANEMINLAAVAIHVRLDYRCLRDLIFTHPSMSEAFNKLLSLIDRHV